MTRTSSIQILPYILAGFCSIRWLSHCSELSKMDGNPKDSLQYPVSSGNEEVPRLETNVVLSDYAGEIKESKMFAMEKFLKSQLLTDDSVFEDVSSNSSDDKKSKWKRDASDGKWSHEDKMRYLQLHNILRGNVTPPAGNMAYLEWDTELERLAQMWANNCGFNHGQPDEARDYELKSGNIIGQNLYYGGDPNGYLGLYLWYKEYHDYDLRTRYCIPNKQCGHYVQLAWSESTKLGCAMTKCLHPRGHPRYLLACNYSPGAVTGVQMYRVAEPCSRCTGNNVLCLKNLCITQEQCKNNPFDCQDAECNLKCYNCGRLDKETCTCQCTDGWDGRDCSQLCKNKNEKCGVSPGYPSIRVCPFLNYEVANTLCRKMCEKCRDMNETSINTCCGKKLCEEGYVFDSSGKSCECELLCPGPVCDCPSFKIRKNMRIVYSKSEEGKTVAAFSCHNNTKLIGSNTSECQPDGIWNISLPYCENCPPFEVKKYMEIEYSESDKGSSVATFSCESNTKLIGSNLSECQPDGKWSSSQPYCENKEVIPSLAAVRSKAESLGTFPSITLWMIILQLLEIYLQKHSWHEFFSTCT